MTPTEAIKHLAKIRRHKKISVYTLAKDHGLHATYIGLLESGRRKPTYALLEKYAAAIGCSIELKVKQLKHEDNE